MSFGNTPRDAGNIPMGSVYSPNSTGANPVALQGGTITTDTEGNESAPVMIQSVDGADATQGLTTDASVVGDSAGTISAKLRGLSKIWNSVWDNVNNRIKVDGSSVTQPVTVQNWQTQTPISQPTSATGTPTSVVATTSPVALLASNTNRKAAYIYNEGSAILYIGLFVHATLSTSVYTTQIAANSFFPLPTSPVYTGEISGVWSATGGNARITELS